MKYDKNKTFEKAEEYLKGKQNIKPQQENYFSKGWYNKHYSSRREAIASYRAAMGNWKSKAKT